ncbi:APC membrane recruitment protein 1 [Pristis pectinata]|uniref:APC membrane recruitment protein 1 n=1 Tax=Pristis pectinata TaxID=685728 RepID=UPI00223E407F|nr:APC membrane recruitment protein 1 [Pristis pectinata]XP_051877067.1 APC membrane recruitment protein 1 [Pristis pectinata]XP_051877068.1 APC membrane recruitment protein 1 [Pristis pectinata]
METGSSEETAGTKALSPGRGELARGSQTQGAAVLAPYDCTDATDTEQSSGKLKKTAFKLFGGRKSICTLPSFFTIKNKGQVKGFSKKGITKSKTLNGISEVALNINQKEGLDTVWGGYSDSSSWSSAASRTLRGSKSEHSALDNSVNSDFHKSESLESENSECFVHKRSTDKPSSERRSKKGLRGLFNSIRRHKKNKAVDSVKDPQDSNSAAAADVFAHTEQPTAGEQGVGVELKKGLVELELNLKPSCKMNYRGASDSADKTGTANSTGSSSESSAFKIENTTRNQRSEFETSGAEVRKVSVGEIKSLNRKPGGAISNLNSSFGSMPDIVKPNCMDHDPPSVHSFDQVSLIFGDVTSLKSFDSLTGCGDIIADHDDDSIAESTVSGERSRTAGKRSSCLVTYQGGGEEMATPDEVEDEYLKALWEKATGTATVFDSSQNIAEDGGECLRSPSDAEHSALHINLSDPCALQGITDSAINSSELVTPQSDHQESAPNSDEGYYDSTTPGHEEEGGDSISESKNGRLPRDSYSGDALYELFEQNDSLINSPPSDEQSLETKPPSLGASLTSILSFSLPVDTNVPCIPSKQSIMIASEQEKFNFIQEDEIRLAHLQQQLTCWESNGKMTFIKDLSVREKEKFSGDLLETEFSKIGTDALGVIAKNQQAAVSTEPLVSSSMNKNGKVKAEYMSEAADGQNWTKIQRLCPKETDNKYMICKRSMCENYSITKLHNNMSEVSFTQEYKNEDSGKWGQQIKNGENHSMKKLVQNSAGANGVVDDLSGSSSDCREVGVTEEKFEQAINYSQALVEFTANRKLYPNLSESLGNSESGSQLTQDIHALPAMVTFDVVDVENEEECDQQSEMVMDEEISASYEAFDNSYLEKDPYHCDNRMFPSCAQNSSPGTCWGAASLPRHSSLYKLSPSLPAPLSLSRRSRSLDTDSLESELTDLYLSKVTAASKSTPQSPDVPPYEWDGRKGSACHWFGKRSGQMVSLETPAIAHDLHCSGQQFAKYREDPGSLDKRNTGFNSFCPSETDMSKLHTNQTGGLSLHCKSNSVKQAAQNQSTCKQNLEPIIKNKMPHNSRKLVRPTHLPLQNDDFVLQTGSCSSSREITTGKGACVSLKERGEEEFCKIASLSRYSDSESELAGKGCGAGEIPRVLSPFHSNKMKSEAQPGSYWTLYSCQ